ncbi:MAG TPA: type 1 glutamine amidotransferase [Thermodesulfobacteriaceae bacterium]|nr:type 1 glutamine amidotransferase [Thermodesulfobacteriaceae bacterium]
MRVLIITADGFEDTELICPMYRLREAGFQVDIAAPEWGEVTGKHGYHVSANLSLDDVEPASYRLLLLPGGKAPALLRETPKVLDIARAFAADSRPIAAICHGPLILLSAGLIQGKKATGYKTTARKLEAGGVMYEDSEVVVDGNIITSREPLDIPAFMSEIMKAIAPAQD